MGLNSVLWMFHSRTFGSNLQLEEVVCNGSVKMIALGNPFPNICVDLRMFERGSFTIAARNKL